MKYEYYDALERWKIARENFYYAEEAYVEVAIQELAAAQEHLNAVIKREKILKAEEESKKVISENIKKSRCETLCSSLGSLWERGLARLSVLLSTRSSQ